METEIQQIIDEMRAVSQSEDDVTPGSLDRWADELQRIIDEEA